MNNEDVINLVADALSAVNPDEFKIEVFPPHNKSIKCDWTIPVLVIDTETGRLKYDVTLRIDVEIEEVEE